MKIRAFTLMEMIVALAISATVTAVTYYAFTSIRRLNNQKQKNLAAVEQLHEFRFLMNYDFTMNPFWSWDENTAQLTTANNEVSYTFKPDQLIRKSSNQITTFTFDRISWEVQNHLQEGMVEGIKMEISRNGKTLPLRIRLNEEAANLINKLEKKSGN